VSFLSQEQQYLAAHFAGKRLERVNPEFELRGRTPILKRAVAAVAADVVDTASCGDHTLFIGCVTSLDVGEATRPLLFHGARYARLDWRAPLDGVEPPQFW
jgi:flavin reductase (DIM6/NTAB) family NADH-FMN oxidoreductase RutF